MTCQDCRGSGHPKGQPSDICPWCKGSGAFCDRCSTPCNVDSDATAKGHVCQPCFEKELPPGGDSEEDLSNPIYGDEDDPERG